MVPEPSFFCPFVRASVHSHFQIQISPHLVSQFQSILHEASLRWGKGCSRFRLDRIRTVVSMAADSSLRLNMGNMKTFSITKHQGPQLLKIFLRSNV